MPSLGTETPRKEGFVVKYNFSYYLPPHFHTFFLHLFISFADKLFSGSGRVLKKSQVALSPVLKVDAHGAHVRGTKESWGDRKAG